MQEKQIKIFDTNAFSSQNGWTTLPKVYGVRKKLDPNVRPEKQHALPKKEVTEKLHYRSGQSRIEKKA